MKGHHADLLMLVVTIFWGSSYLFMDMGLHTISEFNLIALRFGIAFLIVIPILYRRFRKIDLTTILYGLLLGCMLFLIFTCITFALRTTTTSNAGFLISLTVIFVPIINTVVLKNKIETKLMISIILSMIGIGFLTIQIPFHIHVGDLLCILGAFFYALHIIIANHAVKKVDALNLSILQLGFVGIIGLIFSITFETFTFPTTPTGWTAILALSILCSALGFILQIIAQKYTSPSRIVLIFSLEPVFAALFGYLFINEVLSLWQFLGALLVLCSIIFTTAATNSRQPSIHREHYEK